MRRLNGCGAFQATLKNYQLVVFASFLAIMWMIWSGLNVMLPDDPDAGCDCQKVFHVVGHRGLSDKAPENTMPAFELAAQETGFISLDLTRTADQHLVAMHDEYVDRTTDGHGAVSRMTLDDLRKLDAGQWFNPKYKGVRIPTLPEVFETLGNRSRYLLDIRKREDHNNPEGLIQSLADTVHAHGLELKVTLSLDDPEMIKLAKAAMPGATVLAKVNVLYTIVPLSAMWKVVEDSGADGVAAHFLMTLLHNTMIETARQMGKKVFIYTVDSMYVSKWLECLGVDAIVSNNPEKIVSGAECPITGAYGR